MLAVVDFLVALRVEEAVNAIGRLCLAGDDGKEPRTGSGATERYEQRCGCETCDSFWHEQIIGQSRAKCQKSKRQKLAGQLHCRNESQAAYPCRHGLPQSL